MYVFAGCRIFGDSGDIVLFCRLLPIMVIVVILLFTMIDARNRHIRMISILGLGAHLLFATFFSKEFIKVRTACLILWAYCQ